MCAGSCCGGVAGIAISEIGQVRCVASAHDVVGALVCADEVLNVDSVADAAGDVTAIGVVGAVVGVVIEANAGDSCIVGGMFDVAVITGISGI